MTSPARAVDRRLRVLAVGIGLLFIGMLATDFYLNHLIAVTGRPFPATLQNSTETWVIVAAMLSAVVVGFGLAATRPRHPVGWIFVALGAAMEFSGLLDLYATYGLFIRPGGLPGDDLMAVLSDRSFIPWLVLVALALYLTPTGHTIGPRWTRALQATVLGGALGLVGTFAERPLNAPYEQIRNPVGLPGAAGSVVSWVSWLGVLAAGIGLIGSAVSLAVRFRRSRGDDRRQLLWLAFVAVPVPMFVVVAFIAAWNDNNEVTVWATGGFVFLVPVAAGLSVIRFQLYGVERYLARSLTYTVLTVLLVTIYALVVLLATHGLGSSAGSPEVSATLGAVTAAALAAPIRKRAQALIDRRFNRGRFDAIQTVLDGLTEANAGTDLEALFRKAFDDPSSTIAYPADDATWLRADGSVDADRPATVQIRHHDRLVARVGFDPQRVSADTVSAAASEAAPELDNVRLRAELARQLAIVQDSRERLAGAQRLERRRIERDLHDGAQQRLLALAMDLQTARLSRDPGRLDQAAARGVVEAQQAVRELRDLANGLHPAALADEGLSAALEDLASRSPVPLRVNADRSRFAGGLEFTTWLVACEAITNAQKHAHASSITVDLEISSEAVRLLVRDDGRGGCRCRGFRVARIARPGRGEQWTRERHVHRGRRHVGRGAVAMRR